jgi:hypothetical protein
VSDGSTAHGGAMRGRAAARIGARLHVAVALTLTGMQPALAQVDDSHAIGSRVERRTDSHAIMDKAGAAALAQRIATCEVNKRRNFVAMFLNSTDPAVIRTAGFQLSRELTCDNLAGMGPLASAVQTRHSPDVERGFRAEAMLAQTRNLPSLPALPLAHEYHSPFAAVSGRNIVVEEMGVCIAATNPDGVRALLRTAPQTPDEMTAIGTLGGSMHDCLQANVKLSATRESLRATVAEALYHRAITPQTAVSQ